MLTAIKFDYHFLLNAGEIGNILSYGMLTTKTVAVDLLASQCLP